MKYLTMAVLTYYPTLEEINVCIWSSRWWTNSCIKNEDTEYNDDNTTNRQWEIIALFIKFARNIIAWSGSVRICLLDVDTSNGRLFFPSVPHVYHSHNLSVEANMIAAVKDAATLEECVDLL